MSIGESNGEGSKPRSIGSYRIIQQLGSGGMSTVFRCVHMQTNSEVAVKILPRTLAKNPTLLQRFINEAKNAERLQHPNIVAIYDRGFDQGRHYLVLEFVAGGDLQERVRNEGPLPIEEAIMVIREVAEGLRYAARQGVIHRDIKPANLLLSPTGHVKIIDLGLAVETDDEDERVTRHGTTVGTVDYMAPEQAQNSRSTSESSDIYSLGCTLFYLLTGTPPYAGGAVMEKLSKHCNAPIPDIRARRPEAPENLALLVKRMMAKKPVQRFGSHAELLVALGAVGKDGKGTELQETPLVAEIVDDDFDDVPIAEIKEAKPISGPLKAYPVTTPKQPPTSPAPAPPAVSEPFALADLVALDEDASEARPRSRRPASNPSAVLMAQFVDDEDDDLYVAPPSSTRRTTSGFLSETTSLKTFIGIGVAIGLAIALVGLGLIQLYIAVSGQEGSGAIARAVRTPSEEPIEEPVEPVVVKQVTPPKTEPTERPAASTVAIPMVWIEPTDPRRPAPNPGALPVAIEQRFLPDWARSSNLRTDEPASLLVRRSDDGAAGTKASTLANAIRNPDATVEIADDGPFFSSEPTIPGKSRLIKAAAGFRPILVLQPPSTPRPAGPAALVDLDGGSLTLQGIDLVVDAKGLPAGLSTVFVSRGGSLRFQDCSITILNGTTRPLSLVQFLPRSPATNTAAARLFLERTLVRGGPARLVDAGPLALDLVLVHSVFLGGGLGPAVSLQSAPEKTVRRLFLVESLLTSSGSIIELPGVAENPVEIRGYRTVFAKLEPASEPGLLAIRADRIGGALGGIDCLVEECGLSGWSSVVSYGPTHRVRLKDLDAVQKLDPKIAVRCEAEGQPWPASLTRDETSPADLVERLSKALKVTTTLADQVAMPTPGLRFKSVEPFPAPTIPRLAEVAEPSAAPPAGSKFTELSFDASSPANPGDLGVFLQSKKIGPDQKVRVRVSGRGTHPMSPIELPDRITLEIVATPSARTADALVFEVSAGDDTDALIKLRGGSLRLVNVCLSKSEGRRVGSLIDALDSHLVLENCRLASGEKADQGRGTLVSFRSPSSRERGPKEPSPFMTPVALPFFLATNTVMLAHQDAILAELGTGRLSFSNCLVTSERGAAFTFRPGSCARGRFDVAARIEHCTIASTRTFFRIANWPGLAPGPDRPWLIWTRRSLFHDLATNGKNESILIRAGAESLAHNLAFWQGDSNAYDLQGFLSASDLAIPTQRDRADLLRQWVDHWGAGHVVGSVVTSAGSAEGNGEGAKLRFVSRPADATNRLPGDLELDPKANPDLGANFLSLPLGPDQRRKP